MKAHTSILIHVVHTGMRFVYVLSLGNFHDGCIKYCFVFVRAHLNTKSDTHFITSRYVTLIQCLCTALKSGNLLCCVRAVRRYMCICAMPTHVHTYIHVHVRSLVIFCDDCSKYCLLCPITGGIIQHRYILCHYII